MPNTDNIQSHQIGLEATPGHSLSEKQDRPTHYIKTTATLHSLRPGVFSDLFTFAQHHVHSKDIDPVYPVLRAIIDHENMDDEEALWLNFLYVGTYHLPAALLLSCRTPVPLWLPNYEMLLDLPTGTERRGFRGDGGKQRLQTHIAEYIARVIDDADGNQKSWWQQDWTDNPNTNFDTLFSRAQELSGNGRWAGYKWADMMHEVHGWNVGADDLRLRQCTGPREGLAWLYALPTDTPVETLDQLAKGLKLMLHEAGLKLTWEQLETIICDFNSLRLGHYYVGHDIDQMLQQAQAVRGLGEDGLWAYQTIMQARLSSLPDAYLGEYHDWWGVTPARKRAFALTHQILVQGEDM